MNYLEYFQDGGKKDSIPSTMTEIKSDYYLVLPRETTPVYSTGLLDLIVNTLKNEKSSSYNNEDNSINARIKHLANRIDKIVFSNTRIGNLR